MDDKRKRSWAEIDLAALEHNVKSMRAQLPAGCGFVGVVKANAYGHGAVPVAKKLEALGVEYLAVACLEELRQLRGAGIERPVLILGYTPTEYARELAALSATQAVGSLKQAEELAERLAGTGKRLKVHLKLETGMGRTGFRAFGAHDLAAAARVTALPELEAEGIFTHFCVSDADEPLREFTHEQFDRFQKAVEAIEAESGHRFALRHCANSGAMISFPGTYLDMVRPGLALYGLYPGSDRGATDLRPVMALYTRVYGVEEHFPGDSISYGRTYTADRPCRIAVLPMGYADGLHRAASGKLEFMINGHRVPQVGRICMDMCMADVTGLDVKSGDVVQIFGGQIPVEELAEKAGTINYEMTCAVSPRVPRIYMDEGKETGGCV